MKKATNKTRLFFYSIGQFLLVLLVLVILLTPGILLLLALIKYIMS